MRRAGLIIAGVLPAPAAWAAVAPRAWDFTGAGMLIGAGSVVVLVLLGRALAAPALRRPAAGTPGAREDENAR